MNGWWWCIENGIVVERLHCLGDYVCVDVFDGLFVCVFVDGCDVCGDVWCKVFFVFGDDVCFLFAEAGVVFVFSEMAVVWVCVFVHFCEGLSAEKIAVVCDGKDFCFVVELVCVCGHRAACGEAQGCVLDHLEFVDVCFGDDW